MAVKQHVTTTTVIHATIEELQILCFRTLSMSCFYLKHHPVYISKHNVSENIQDDG
jgi:hypothetical protein